MKRFIPAFAGLCLIFSLSGGVLEAEASQVISAKITDLMRANVAFTGRCVGVEPLALRLGERGEAFATKYTFAVEEAIKGDVPETFTFTHLGGTREGAAEVGLAYIPGMPAFGEGKRYTVFLSSETPLGLRGVINLGCGKFNFVEGADGKVQVINDYGNKSLFTGLPGTAKVGKALSAGGISPDAAAGPVDYDSFLKVVKDLEGKE